MRKLQAEHHSPLDYYLPLGEERIHLNPYLGKKIQLSFSGAINCIQCDRNTSKSFQQGYCYPCMRRLHECDMCMLHPERCHVEEGTCPTDDWAHAHCHQQHIVYLANSSALKVGITRVSQMPTRWIDQGAVQALPIFRVQNRYQSGLVEVALKAFVADKTNWRAMLRGQPEALDLVQQRDRLLTEAKPMLDGVIAKYDAGVIEPLTDNSVVSIDFPVLQYPVKISSLSFDKTPEISGVLQGIKGQYLLLDSGVLNIRKFGGYNIQFESW